VIVIAPVIVIVIVPVAVAVHMNGNAPVDVIHTVDASAHSREWAPSSTASITPTGAFPFMCTATITFAITSPSTSTITSRRRR
jgi:hypothetical protein